jgi:hypothetical protein
MDWLFSNGWSESALGHPSAQQHQDYGQGPWGADTVTGGRGGFSAIELWLVRLAYEDMAAELGCKKCKAHLGRELHFVPPGDFDPPWWRLMVVTRCSGWRRHRHVAGVTEAAKNLLFGRFEPN